MKVKSGSLFGKMNRLLNDIPCTPVIVSNTSDTGVDTSFFLIAVFHITIQSKYLCPVVGKLREIW